MKWKNVASPTIGHSSESQSSHPTNAASGTSNRAIILELGDKSGDSADDLHSRPALPNNAHIFGNLSRRIATVNVSRREGRLKNASVRCAVELAALLWQIF